MSAFSAPQTRKIDTIETPHTLDPRRSEVCIVISFKLEDNFQGYNISFLVHQLEFALYYAWRNHDTRMTFHSSLEKHYFQPFVPEGWKKIPMMIYDGQISQAADLLAEIAKGPIEGIVNPVISGVKIDLEDRMTIARIQDTSHHPPFGGATYTRHMLIAHHSGSEIVTIHNEEETDAMFPTIKDLFYGLDVFGFKKLFFGGQSRW